MGEVAGANGWLGGGLALALVAVATGVVLALLNARDRRRDRVAALVACVCATPSLRGRIALRVRAPLLRRRTVVVLDMSACSPDLIWPTLRRVGAILPRETALAIQASVDGELRVAVTIAAQFI